MSDTSQRLFPNSRQIFRGPIPAVESQIQDPLSDPASAYVTLELGLSLAVRVRIV
jgi:hypothetical protein